MKCIEKTINELEGTWGLVILNIEEPNKLYCTRQGSPLLVSTDNNICIVASEQSAFCNKVNNYIILKNNDICEIQRTKDKLIKISTKNIYKQIKVLNTNIQLTPHPYKFWTEKEIYEQDQVV